MLGQLAGLVRRVEDLVVKDREVQGKTETDRVSRGEVGLRNLGGGLVGLKGLVGRALALVTECELGQVAVVVTLPVFVKLGDQHFRSRRGCGVGLQSGGTHILW